ncbi:MAG TPA: hypothetical protein DEP87_00755 [Candidatus Pacebacteria bacterium]|nr:hypothetical protein [Candidatus Paceibacterota bacterium]
MQSHSAQSPSNPTVVMLTPSCHPAHGGVETHVAEVSQELNKMGWQVLMLTPPPINKRPGGKLGLIWLWGWMLGQLPLLSVANVIQIHDVFLWFWPVWPLIKLIWWYRRILGKMPGKIITTFHGWEGNFPPTFWQKFNKWLAEHLSTATVAVGDYLPQFYPIRPQVITYGGVRVSGAELSALSATSASLARSTDKPDLIYFGRLADDTGLALLLETLKNEPQNDEIATLKLEFWGDGSLRSACQKFGTVVGWVDQPVKKLQQLAPTWVLASGYLSVLEALAVGHKVVVIADNQLKLAYYQLSPLVSDLVILKSPTELRDFLSHQFKTPILRTDSQIQARRIQQQFSWQKVAKIYQTFYET